MAGLIQWQNPEERGRAVRQAAALLGQDGLVAIPTETVYGIAANPFSEAAVERLMTCKGRPEDRPLTLALGRGEDCRAWIGSPGRIASRLIQRSWPGPVTLVFDIPEQCGPLHELPAKTRQRVAGQGTLGIRVPAHEAATEILLRLPAGALLTSANRSGKPDLLSGQEVFAVLGDHLDLVIDDGPTTFGRPSSVVRVWPDRWELLRQGAVSHGELEKLAATGVLFVCTGNTCRSPLARVLCEKLLAERLGCAIRELPRHGFVVRSAGIAAFEGTEASPEAVVAARRYGGDLEDHTAQPVSEELVVRSDLIYAMTESHLSMLKELFPEKAAAMRLLAPAGEDIYDPIGSDSAVYEQCAEQICRCLEQRLEEILFG
jgi:protein-tyrosine phosphatase